MELVEAYIKQLVKAFRNVLNTEVDANDMIEQLSHIRNDINFSKYGRESIIQEIQDSIDGICRSGQPISSDDFGNESLMRDGLANEIKKLNKLIK